MGTIFATKTSVMFLFLGNNWFSVLYFSDLQKCFFFLRVLIRSKMFSIGKNFSKKKKTKPFFSWYLKGLEISAKLFYQYLCIFSISKVLILFFFFYSGPTTFMGGRIDGWFWKPTHSVITSLKMKQNMAAEALSAWVKLWLQ